MDCGMSGHPRVCVSQGMTREEAIGNIREAIQMVSRSGLNRVLPLTVETREVVRVLVSMGWILPGSGAAISF